MIPVILVAARLMQGFSCGGEVGPATTYLLVQMLRHPLPSLSHGGWHGFWTGADYTIAVAVSFAPLASDYTRHARSGLRNSTRKMRDDFGLKRDLSC